jgi:hypothetical protein
VKICVNPWQRAFLHVGIPTKTVEPEKVNGENMKRTDVKNTVTASQRIENYINELSDWRGKMVAGLRKLIREAVPELTEEWKWDTPVWSCKGNVVAVGVFKDHVKLNFFKGASLKDPYGLFNAGLEAKATRAIDLHEGDQINASALKELIREAVAHNTGKETPSRQ